MNARTSLPGKILRAAALVVIVASLFGMPGAAVPARAQAEGTDPHTPVQSPPLEQGGVDHQTLLDSMAAAPGEMSVVPLPENDDRIRITPTDSIPWRYIAQILFTYPSGPNKICTGYFIGPHTIVTAGHCVYDPVYGWTNRADVTPGQDGTTQPYGMAQAILTYSTDAWVNSGDPLYDYGAVQLDPSATIGYSTGWMEYGYFSDSYLGNYYLTGTANLAGYPMDKDAACGVGTAACLWWDSGPLTQISDTHLSYGMDTDFGDAGQDGAPIWVNDGGHFYATGINLFDAGGFVFPETDCLSGNNCGLRITPEMAVNFTTWSGQGPVTDCYTLALTHTGEGSDPAADPIKSQGCAPGQYLPGTIISLTASPAAHWEMDSWTGTNDDTSTALTNEVTMPASYHTVTANYRLICYAFSAAVTPVGGGSIYFNPPSNCPGGYGEGATVELVGLASSGYALKNWTGSLTSTSNPLTFTVSGPMSITANFVPALSGGTYDDQHPAFVYAPTPVPNYPTIGTNWTNYPSFGGPYLSTLHLSKGLGDSATVTIYGTGFKLYYTQGANREKMDVYLDDGVTPFATINMYGTTTVWKKLWTSPAIPAGVHTLRFVHVDGTLPGQIYADIDGLIVVPVPDIVPPAAISNLAAATGTSGGSVNLTWTAPGDDITAGTATSYLVRYSASPITSESAWNAATPITSGLPVPAAGGSPQSMTAAGLTPGATFYFAVRAKDEVANQGGLSNSPDAAAQVVIPLGMGVHDDNNSNISYGGAWIYYPLITGPYLKTLHLSNTVGNSATFYYSGASFTLTYTAAANRGKMDVYIDNVKVATLNMYSLATVWQKKWISPTVPMGIHTVRLVHFSGTYVDVDAITIPDSVPPAAIINLNGASGAAPGSVTLTWDAVGDDGISGTAASYQVRYSNTPISTEVLWTAATPITVGVPVPGPFGTPETMTVTGLFPGNTYYFSVRAKDDVGNLGGLSNSPGLQAAPTSPLAVGMHDDPNPNIVYLGAWTFYPSLTVSYGSTLHMATATTTGAAANNQVIFSFTGNRFILNYVKAPNRGIVDVYLDGIKVTTLNLYNSTTIWRATWDSELVVPTMPYGTHTVRLQQIFVSTTRPYMDVDAIEVRNDP
ncbi:MAG: mpr [Anaerolineaceae bacterium]|nr:MAG: mpr [Anaerolineaceae bacterium]